MTISANVSFFAQSMSQANRLNDLRATMDDLQRQVTTQKKYETFSGFGTDSFSLQRLKSSQPLLRSYIDNIDKVSTRMELMNTAMTKISELGNQLVTAIHVQSQSGQDGIETINQLARQSLQFVEDLINQTLDGHCLFAGSDVTSPPFIGDTVLNSNFKTQVDVWLAGGQTNAQLIAVTDGFTSGNLGLAPGLATSGNITAHIDQNMDIDYTIRADEDGFKDILRALAFAANLRYPDPATDVATPAQFDDILNNILSVVTNGVQEMNRTAQQLASKFDLLKSIRENHVSDLGMVTTQIDKMENVDTTTALVSLQTMQTQLTASYQITKIVSELSLVNFM
ncbi:MAG: hypothetical protein V1721_00620 [Pseudomonadota bacterium]